MTSAMAEAGAWTDLQGPVAGAVVALGLLIAGAVLIRVLAGQADRLLRAGLVAMVLLGAVGLALRIVQLITT